MCIFKKRAITFGDYNTADHGWTLTGWKLSAPEQKTSYVEKSGGDGSWDLSTVMTDGIPKYKDRTLTVTLECSKGTRADREEKINHMVNLLDGLEWEIVLPDRPDHFLTGRLHVAVDYSDLAHAAVTVTGLCKPWLYYRRETVVELQHSISYLSTHTLRNTGRLAVVPTLIVESDTEGIELSFGEQYAYVGLVTGTYSWPDLHLTPGDHELRFLGKGKVTIVYREAVLR